MPSSQPIGVFDSGYGGLTVLKSIVEKLPGYDFIYLGDNARAPYGNRSFETVYQYTREAVQWFFSKGCPLVILACNTSSAKALRTIQQQDLMAPIQRKAAENVQTVAKENGYSYVFLKDALLVSPPADDLLPIVKKKLGLK